MSETTDGFELFTSSVLATALFIYVWYKRKTQFGSPRSPVQVYTGDRPIRCHVCSGDNFQKREGLLNTTWVTLFKLDPFNESATCLVCASCGYVHWFARRRGVFPHVYLRYEANSSRHEVRAVRAGGDT